MVDLNHLSSIWDYEYPLRNPFVRRQALVEIDVLTGHSLGLALNEQLTIHRVQFSLMQKNEFHLLYDQCGMQVPVKTSEWVLKVDESHPEFPEMTSLFPLSTVKRITGLPGSFLSRSSNLLPNRMKIELVLYRTKYRSNH